MARKKTRSKEKSSLWEMYQKADFLTKKEIQLELQKADIFMRWLQSYSYSGYNLFYAPAPLRDTFIRLIPESAPLFEKNANLQSAEA